MSQVLHLWRLPPCHIWYPPELCTWEYSIRAQQEVRHFMIFHVSKSTSCIPNIGKIDFIDNIYQHLLGFKSEDLTRARLWETNCTIPTERELDSATCSISLHHAVCSVSPFKDLKCMNPWSKHHSKTLGSGQDHIGLGWQFAGSCWLCWSIGACLSSGISTRPEAVSTRGLHCSRLLLHTSSAAGNVELWVFSARGPL